MPSKLGLAIGVDLLDGQDMRERERERESEIERGQDVGGEQDLRRGLRVRYVRASDVRRGSVEKREKEQRSGRWL